MGRVQLKKVKKAAIFRKIAMGTWKTAKDPSTYALCEIDMQPVYDLLPAYSEKHGIKITPSHLIGKAMINALKEVPHANVMIRGSRIFQRESVSLFYQVNIPSKKKDGSEKANLSGCSIHQADDLSTAEVATFLKDKATKVRENKDKEVTQTMNAFKFVPWFLAGWVLDITSWLTYGLNINLSFLGLPRDPFGSVMITNIGSLGIETGFAPLVPFSRVPLLLAVGKVVDRAWVVDGEIKIRPILRIGATVDHRIIDGVHGAHIMSSIQKYFAEPEKYLLAE